MLPNDNNSKVSAKEQNKASAKNLENFSRLRESVTIGKRPEVVFSFWRNFANFPLFMKEIAEVRVTSPKTSHWVVDLPRGPKVEWDAEITHEVQNEVISWQSVNSSYVDQVGAVMFSPASGGRGTVVSLSLLYKLTGGAVTELATKLLLEDPKSLIMGNLRRVKAYLETGEIPTVDGQSSGRDENSQEIETTQTDIH